MKRQKGSIFLFCIVAFMLTLFMTIAQSVKYTAQNAFADSVLVDFSSSDSRMTYDDIDIMRKKGISVSGQYAEKDAIYTNSEKIPVSCIYTDSAYETLSNLVITNGRFIRENQDEVVIGSSLAEKLFMTEHASGLKIQIGGREYTVCGVYKESENILAEMSKGLEQVYFAYDKTDSNILFSQALYRNDSQTPVNLLLPKSVYSVLNAGNDYNLYEESVFLTSFADFVLLLLWIFVIIEAVRFVITEGKSFTKKVKLLNQDGYMSYTIKKSTLPFVRFVSLSILSAAVCIVLYMMLDFNFYIPQRFLPSDKIFDLSFYLKQIIALFNGYNMIPPEFAGSVQTIRLMFIFSFMLFLLCLVFTAVFAVMRKNAFDRVYAIAFSLLSVLLGAVSGMAVCATFGLDFKFFVAIPFILGVLVVTSTPIYANKISKY